MSRAGFTLIEVLVTVAVLAMIFAIGGITVSVASSRFAERSTAISIHDILSTASGMARDGEQDSAWGVYIPFNETTRIAPSVTIFAGDTYATRDTTLDIIRTIPRYIRFTDVSLLGASPSDGNDHEIIFHKYTGDTDEYGVITVDVFAETMIFDVSSIGIDVRR